MTSFDRRRFLEVASAAGVAVAVAPGTALARRSGGESQTSSAFRRTTAPA